jgi:hypothetical protein
MKSSAPEGTFPSTGVLAWQSKVRSAEAARFGTGQLRERDANREPPDADDRYVAEALARQTVGARRKRSSGRAATRSRLGRGASRRPSGARAHTSPVHHSVCARSRRQARRLRMLRGWRPRRPRDSSRQDRRRWVRTGEDQKLLRRRVPVPRPSCGQTANSWLLDDIFVPYASSGSRPSS